MKVVLFILIMIILYFVYKYFIQKNIQSTQKINPIIDDGFKKDSINIGISKELQKIKREEGSQNRIKILNDGWNYEHSGELLKAAELYEILIDENFEGNYPYDRLSIIYRKLNKIEEEIRVLNKAIFVFNTIIYKGRLDCAPKLDNFHKRLNKANILLLKAQATAAGNND